jgi:hypothetical protein
MAWAKTEGYLLKKNIFNEGNPDYRLDYKS